ncbi:MAG: hypothetical protein AAF433_19045 [Bacteroidota bacterium]
MHYSTSKITAASALFQALAYIFGFALMLTVLNPLTEESWTSEQRLFFLIEQQVLYQVWILVIYILFGLVLIVLTSGLRIFLTKRNDLLDFSSPIFGYVWSGLVIASGMITHVGIDQLASLFDRHPQQAAITWSTLEMLQNGLGGGVEIVGGIWVLLVSIQAQRQSAFPRWLIYLGMAVGLSGMLTILPGLSELGAVFGLLQIVWFLGIARRLYRA